MVTTGLRVLLVVASLSVMGLSQPPPPQQQSLTTNQQTQGTQQPSASSNTTTTNAQSPTTTTCPNANAVGQNSDSWIARALEPISLLTLALVGLTAWYVYAALGQLAEIRRQADIAKEQADTAAEASRTAAESLGAMREQLAVMQRQTDLMERQVSDLQRPRIIPYVSDENTEAMADMLRFHPRDEDSGKIWTPEVSMAFANYGPVPGWIVERYYDLYPFEIDNSNNIDLPADPPYGDHGTIERTCEIPIPDSTRVQQLSRLLFFGPDNIRRIRDGELALVFFGYIKYRGVFRDGPIYETRFCWTTTRKVIVHADPSYSGPPTIIIRFEQDGPANWTRYT